MSSFVWFSWGWVLSSGGELPIEVPRDRKGTFEPQLIPKHQTRWAGFDDKIISLYARGMTVREIQSHLEEMYGTEVSPSLMASHSSCSKRLLWETIIALGTLRVATDRSI